jgi:hypothetical protein
MHGPGSVLKYSSHIRPGLAHSSLLAASGRRWFFFLTLNPYSSLHDQLDGGIFSNLESLLHDQVDGGFFLSLYLYFSLHDQVDGGFFLFLNPSSWLHDQVDGGFFYSSYSSQHDQVDGGFFNP